MKKLATPKVIDYFRDDWSFLSNFYPCYVEMDGVAYASTEHAYQAAKTLDPEKREIFTLNFNPRLTPAKAKQIGRKVALRPDWEEVKLDVMRSLLMKKFNQSIFRRKLIATFGAELIEGNWWHDTFYGVCYGGQVVGRPVRADVGLADYLEGEVPDDNIRDGFHGRTCREWPHDPTGENHLGILLMEVRKLVTANYDMMPSVPQLKDGVPCAHSGCLAHVSHLCEGCGRIGGISGLVPVENKSENS